MKIFYAALLFLILSTQANAQCPDFGLTVSETKDACFGVNDGRVSVKLFGGGAGTYTTSNFSLWLRSGFAYTPIAATGTVFNGDSIVYTGLQPSVEIIAGGNYVVRFTDPLCALGSVWEIYDDALLRNTEILANGSTTAECTGNDGEILVAPSGGTGPYGLVWSGGPTPIADDETNPTNLLAGTYNLTITDAIGCTENFSFVVNTQPDASLASSGSTSICLGETTTVQVTVALGTGPYTVVIDTIGSGPATYRTINNYTSGSDIGIEPNATNTYTLISVTDAGTCSASVSGSVNVTVNPLPADPTNPVDNSFCLGGTPTALSVDDPGAGFRIDWYDASTGGSLVGTGFSFTPAGAGTYWAEVVNETTSCSSANRVSATLSTDPLPPDATNPVDNSFCAGDPLTAIAVDDPGAGFRIDWYDASTGGTFVATGFSFIPPAAGTYWAEVVNTTTLCASANRVSATLTQDPLPADATNPVDNVYCTGDPLTSISVDDPGVGFRIDWYDASTGGSLVGTGVPFTPASAGTYWAEVVDLTTSCLSASRVSATLTEVPIPPDATNPVSNSFCIGSSPTAISVDDPGPGYQVDWYDASTGGSLVGTGVSFIPAGAGTYWAEIVAVPGSCVSANRVSATLSTDPLPADPTNPVDNSYCAGDPLTAIAVDDPGAGFRIDWYDASTGGNYVGTGFSFIPPASGTYWATVVNTTTLCASANRISATLTEDPLPADATNPADNVYCIGNPLTAISVDDPGAGFRVDWYDASTGGSLVGTGVPFTPGSAGTYWAEIVDLTTSCISANRVSATLTEVPIPPDATNPVDNSYCVGSSPTSISVDDPGAGFQVDWYDASTGGSLLGTGSSFTPAGAGTYWAEIVKVPGGCISANRVSATLSTDPLPPSPSNPVDNSYCEGAALTAISVDDPGAGFRIDWYDAGTGGSLVGTGISIVPPAAGTFWAEIVNETTSCTSANRISATLSEIPKPPALTIVGENNPACQATGEIYTVLGQPGSTYVWTVPLGASIVGPTTGPSITVDFGLNSGDITAVETTVDGCVGDVATLGITLGACPFAADFVTDVTEVCVNGTVQFTNASSAPGGTNYSWDFGVDATPATAGTEGPHNVTYSSTGTKSITLTITNGPLNDAITKDIEVVDPPTADLSGSTSTCAGGSANLTVNLTGTGPWVFVYNDGTSDITENINSSPHLISVSPVATTTYTAVSVDDALCSGSVSGAATINIAPPKEVKIRIDSISSQPANLIWVPVRLIDYEDLMTMQFTVTWDPNLLTYNDVTDFEIANLSESNFGTADVATGALTVSWNTASLSDTTIADSLAIFAIEFLFANTVCSDASVAVDTAPTAITPMEMADENLCLANITAIDGNVENLAPAAITSSDADNSICYGQQVIFTGAPAGMPTYRFYLNGAEMQAGGNNVYVIDTLVDQDSVNVIVDDLQGCSQAATGIVTDVTQIIVTPTVTDVSACGASDGAITLAVSGGSGNYSYSWTGPSIIDQSLKDQANLARGDYNVVVMDNVAICAQVLDITVSEPVTFTLSTTKTDVSATGGSDGAIDLTITGGTGPFDVLWSGPNGFSSTLEDISGLFAGTYDAIVTDTGTGCVDGISVEITQPINALVLNATKTDVSTCGASDGTINLLIVGGSGSFAISWVGPNGFTSNNQNLAGLEGGLYIATVVDLVTSLSAQWSVLIDEPEGFTLATNVSDLSACTSADGEIALDVTGGSGNFSYSWSDLMGYGFTSTSKDVTGLQLGVYRVVVTDNTSSCVDSIDATVGRPIICDQPCALYVESTTNNTSCPESTDGTAVINIISGGSGPGNYYVSLDTGATYTPFAGLDITAIVGQGQGSFMYIVKDTVTGCLDTTVANIGVSTNLQANISISNPGCSEVDGIITFSISGGLSPFDVDLTDSVGNVTSISGNGFIQFTDLTAGSYAYAIREQSGCSIVSFDSVDLFVDCNPGGCGTLVATASSFEDATCGSQPNGKAIVEVTGGSSPYEYSADGVTWIPFISGNVIDQLPADGIYNIAVRQDADNPDCRAEVEVEIYGPPEIVMESPIMTIGAASCNQNDGSVKIGRVVGGTGVYNYQVDGKFIVLPADSILTNLGAGIHTFSVVDAVSCVANFDFTVDSPGVIVASSVDIPVSCTSLFLKAGIRVELDLGLTTLPGPYEAYIASANDPNNGKVYQIPDNGIRTVLNLDKDFYNIVVSSSLDGGCDYSETIPVFSGASPLDFDIIDSDSVVSCIGDYGSITIGNVTGDPDTTYIVQLLSETSVILDTYEVTYYELEGGFTIDESNSSNLVSGNYYINMIQNQAECPGVETSSDLITIYEPLANLGFEVLEDDVSLADRPTGYIMGEIIASGGNPYEAQIQLVEPLFQMNVNDIIEFNSLRVWERVPSTGDNLNRFPAQFDSLWAGLYEIRIRDAYGCQFTMEHSIGYDETVFIPNVFTPNDDGYNDTFYIRNLPESGTQVVISNRAGEVVFESDNYTIENLWDGAEFADGIYYYKVIMSNGESYKGWVEKWSGSRP